MIIDNNKNLIKNNAPEIWNEIKEILDVDCSYVSEVENTRDGLKTLLVKKDNKKQYFHSKYNPLREAETIINTSGEVDDTMEVLFYGLGLGYHVNMFLEKNPNIKIYIYEPSIDLFLKFLETIPLTRDWIKSVKGIVVGSDGQKLECLINKYLNHTTGKTLIIELPTHKKLFDYEYRLFHDVFLNAIKAKEQQIHTTCAYQRLWSTNCINNLCEIIKTPNILLGNLKLYKDKPVVIVSAGPSLNEEIDNIKEIKRNGSAYIFAAGSAINTLLHHGIYPDAACTFDPTDPADSNQFVFGKLKEENITEIPLIFGSSVGRKTILNYPGKKYHMITSQDSISPYFLKPKTNEEIEIIADATSIAVVTLQLLCKLEFGPIILVGQNLAFKGKKRYSMGIEYSKEVLDEEIKEGISVKDVYGNDIITNQGYNRMRKDLEFFVKRFNNVEVINTTKFGADIEGTKFIELQEVMREYLTEKVVDEKWLDIKADNYCFQYSLDQIETIDEAYIAAQSNIGACEKLLNRIKSKISKRSYAQLEDSYVKLDSLFSKLEKNDYIRIFILPMNRVKYKILVDSIVGLNAEKNPLHKGFKIEERFREFLNICKRDMEVIYPMYEEMKEKIKEYVSGK